MLKLLCMRMYAQVLSSLGQSSMLHLRGGLVDARRISRALQALQVPLLALMSTTENVQQHTNPWVASLSLASGHLQT